jgi:hypothetical protein
MSTSHWYLHVVPRMEKSKNYFASFLYHDLVLLAM